MLSVIDSSLNLKRACELLRDAQTSGGGLLILSGAGLSVQSGVPVFRMADGSMSSEFMKFLGDYNEARVQAGLEAADSWFQFSVPEMFREETAFQAWQYWRWRTLRALVKPAQDYQLLGKLIDAFGPDRVFAVTSNCDMLHASAGLSEDNIYEIHGSLGYLQCSEPCTQELYPVDEAFLKRLRDEPNWVPQCPDCKKRCLRPNVMIFGDYALVERRLDTQESKFEQFKEKFLRDISSKTVVLEIGAGRVVNSIRHYGETLGSEAAGLIRINPSTNECLQLELPHLGHELLPKYIPLDERANVALSAICNDMQML